MMLKKTLLGVMLAVVVSIVLVTKIRFDVTEALEYGSSGTSVGGVIWENATWTSESGPYTFVDNVTVHEGVTLTIEAGVSINFDLWMLRVDGTLRARGNQSHRIIMYSYDEPLFKHDPRIHFSPSSTPWDESKRTGCTIEYARIEFYYHSGPMIRGDFARISNCMILSHGETALITKGIASNNTVVGYYRGIFAGGNCSILDNAILGAEHGIHLGTSSPRYPHDTDSPIIVGNLVLDNGNAITLGGSWGHPYITNNTLVNNSRGLNYPDYGDGDFVIVNNNIHDNAYDFFVEREDPRITINITHNWWGTINTSLIDQKIYDQKDNKRLCLVNYSPVLTSPASAPPVSSTIRISGVTQEPEQEGVEPFQEVRVWANVTDQIIGVGRVELGYSVDGGSTWNYSTMTYNEALRLYEGVIPGQHENTLVKYYVHASDEANEYYANEDNQGQYYVYTVIPEFPSFLVLPLFVISALLAIIVYRRRIT